MANSYVSVVASSLVSGSAKTTIVSSDNTTVEWLLGELRSVQLAAD